MMKLSLELCSKSLKAMSMKEENVPEAISCQEKASSGGNSTIESTYTKEFEEYFPENSKSKILAKTCKDWSL